MHFAWQRDPISVILEPPAWHREREKIRQLWRQADLDALLLAREHTRRVYQRDLFQQLVGTGRGLKLGQEAVAILRQALHACIHTSH